MIGKTISHYKVLEKLGEERHALATNMIRDPALDIVREDQRYFEAIINNLATS
jgi:hypothetical protein